MSSYYASLNKVPAMSLLYGFVLSFDPIGRRTPSATP